jgi:hypothetical protein
MFSGKLSKWLASDAFVGKTTNQPTNVGSTNGSSNRILLAG